MSVNFDEVFTLLKIEELTRGHPNLKALGELATHELLDLADDAQEELDEIAKEAKADEEKAAAAAAEAKPETDEDEEEDE